MNVYPSKLSQSTVEIAWTELDKNNCLRFLYPKLRRYRHMNEEYPLQLPIEWLQNQVLCCSVV
jgi:hypothetical protein